MRRLTLLSVIVCLTLALHSQTSSSDDKGLLQDKYIQSLQWRGIGPAFASGRIADIAVHPEHEHTWYVAVASGGVWKTTNSGHTWASLFDGQDVYSTGCITIDPHNPHRIWLGTGENVGGRHIAWGDGVYLSEDDGASWKNMGLKESEHISKIIVHPEDQNTLWVASQGPLWSSGGQRGLYMSTDDGQTWERTLGDDEWMGVTDLVIDPRDPDVLYAATWQRHRTVAAFMGGGPKSGLHKSTDGGRTWTKLTKGLPKGNMGKIGLAISPQKPDVLYAAIELDRRKGGVYKSTNQGASWAKQSDAVSGATGPHYYQELYASPHNFDELYLMDVRIQVSYDGGKTFTRLKERDKHSDNHAIVFRKDDPNYLLIGTDAGIYESFDKAEHWRFIDNLPLTQYYKLAVDDQAPFYWIYGGTQDNGSHAGPSRTNESTGIRNAHWQKTLFADGHQSATTPGDPDIFYAETQQGGMHRIDRITGEQVSIQPQPAPGEPAERFNWDAPIVVSPHDPHRLYFASYRVWKSDDQGDNWTAISGDLTTGQERIELPIMGGEQGWDSPWDLYAMSKFSTITSLSESPVQAGLLYVGTDDGVIQVSEDDGANWRKIPVSRLPGVPAEAFVNDIRADLHDANTVYVCLDNHKSGDFRPYLYKSTDRGVTWRKASSGIPDGSLTWRMVQDHVDPNLLFAATEFGVYASFDGGGEWMKFSGGLPTISLRDITIQRRENDIVAASFGRGFFVLDDYSPLRSMSQEELSAEAGLFPVKYAYQYPQRQTIGTQGASMYKADNPPYGATFTYFINDEFASLAAQRKKEEGEKKKANRSVGFAGWDRLTEEGDEDTPMLIFTIRDQAGNVMNRLEKPYRKGIHRTSWDLRMAPQGGLQVGGRNRGRGLEVLPGRYTVQMSKLHDGVETDLGESQQFEVKRLHDGAQPAKSLAVQQSYREDLSKMMSAMSAIRHEIEYQQDKVAAMEVAARRTNGDTKSIVKDLHLLSKDLKGYARQLNGDPNKSEVGVIQDPTINSYYFNAMRGAFGLSGPTGTNQASLGYAKEAFQTLKSQLNATKNRVAILEGELIKLGAPYIMGQEIPGID